MSILVGITGGMGAGKSTFAAMLCQQGARLVDADRIGHEVIERPEVKAALAAASSTQSKNPKKPAFSWW